MARIPDAFIDELLARSDIVDVIGTRVPLKKAGREFQARCPFHDERSPSFTVSPTKQFYHCFGCGAHGSAIKFLMEYDRLEFLDAVEELAKRAGMDVPRETRQQHQRGDFESLYACCDAAATYFGQQLGGSRRAKDYLQRRGVSSEVAQRFGLGYAPEGWEHLKTALGSDERRLALLEKVGLLSRNDQGRVYDKFRDRLIFPIHDRRGRVIAFGGRVLEKDDGPKYLNSPETPLFHKGRELYGLWQVRQAHSRIPRLIVVEGYMDVVSLFQFGVNTAVATLGTATTPDHAELLFRNAADVYFGFDGDRAGRGAAWKALESVLPRMRDGRQAFFLFLPDGEDPDSLVRAEGSAGFDRHLEQAVPLGEYLFDEVGRECDLTTIGGRARLAERARPLLEQIPDGAFRDLMHQRLGELSGLQARVSATASATPATSSRQHPAKRSLVRTAIALLLTQPELALEVHPPFGFASLDQPGIPLLLELLDLCRSRPGIVTAAILEHFAERDEGKALHKLAMTEFPGEPDVWRTEFADAMQQLDRQASAQELANLVARKSSEGLGPEDTERLRALLRARAG